MRKYSRFFMASVIWFTFQKLHSQNQFAILEKNHNVRAKDLMHELNAAKDTLVLICAKTIDYVYAISSDYKREIDFCNNTNSLQIPLNQLSTGKHVFVVGHSRMQIVFVVRVAKDKATLALVSKNKITAREN